MFTELDWVESLPFFDYGKKMVAGKARRLNYWVGFVAFLESTLEEIGGDFQVCINTL